MMGSVFGAALVRWRRRATEMVLTDRRLIVLEGFLKPVDRAIRLSDIKTIAVKQDAIAKSLDYGTVEIGLQNGEQRTLKPLAEAPKFVEWVKQVADPDSEAGGPRQAPEPDPTWSVTSDPSPTG
jgi:hypothetical protein